MRMQGLVLKALCSTLLLLALVTTAYSQSDCSQAESCDLCVGNSIPTLTGCVWRVCPDDNLGVCVTDEGNSNDISLNCSWTRVAELCTAVETVAEGSEDCSQAESCDLCVGGSIVTETGCVWRLCPNDNGIGVCMTDEGNSNDSSMNCSWTRVAELCTAVEIVAEAGSEDDDKTNSDFSQAKFDMSSFIGGIILVLCLQAGGFFAMRFLKTKEQSSYDPIEQPQ